ncbi:MAG: LamG domain-containing protein [Sedimentisphaerales bacterium]
MVFRKWVDIPVFVLANVVVDAEVLILAGIGAGWSRHKFCHTLLGGAIVGLLWGVAAYPLRHWFSAVMRKLHIPYEPSLRKMAISGIMGALLHVLIDGLYHCDAKIFWPNGTFSIRRLIYRCGMYIGTDQVYRHQIVQEQVRTISIGLLFTSVLAYVLMRKTTDRSVAPGFLRSCAGSRSFWLLSVTIVTILYGILCIFPEGKTTEAHNTATDESPRSELLALTRFDATPDKDLLGCWRFETVSRTTALDLSGNSNTGTITGARWASAATGHVLDLDGAGDFVKIASDPSLDNLKAITLAAWVYPRADAHWHVLDKGDGDKRLYALGIKKRLIGLVRYKGTHASSESASDTIMLGRWQHVAMTWSQTTNKTRVFLNGREVQYSLQEVGSGTVLDDSEHPFFIGARGNLSDGTFLDGRIDDVLIYGRALNPAEVMALYKCLTSDSDEQSNRTFFSN